MEWPDCKFIAISLTAHAACVLENRTGEMLSQFLYPPAMHPTSLALHETGEKACLALAENEQGAIYILNLKQKQSYRLPIEIPAPGQFAITPNLQHAYFATANATLYHLNLSTLQSKAFAQPDQGTCVGIQWKNQLVYTLWEMSGEGILAVFTESGELYYEKKLAATPTNFCLTEQEILISFTESADYGEGIAILTADASPRYLTIQDLSAPYTPHLYPCSITPDESKEIAYVVHEDGGAITSIDLRNYTLQQTFSVGRSISNLYLLPDTRFALATSNMFADLMLLDLVNHRLLSISDSTQEFSNMLAMIH